ncbi:MAG: DUF1552 domain-containing protein [Myxococcota bacterium]
MSFRGWNRRTVLRGVLGGSAVAVAIPWLESLGTAAEDGFPRRFGVFFWGNGTLPGDPDKPSENPDRWTPIGEGSGSAWSLSEQLAPLAAHKDVLTVVSGLSMKLPNPVPHGSGAAGVLSGAPLSSDALESFTAATIDQVIAAAIGDQTLYASLQTAATDTLGLSFSGPNARHPCETSPFALYQRLFGDTFVEPGAGGLVSPTLGLRRSVLDAVTADLGRLNARVSAADRIRLDQHATGVRELEQRLARLEEDPPDLAACTRPSEPDEAYPDDGDYPQFGPRNVAMAELLAMALACDQTRVFSHFLTEPINNTRFPGTSDGHHNLTHDEVNPQPQVDAITVQCIEQFAAFLTALRAIPEGDGTLLDSCAVLGCSETSYGRIHSKDNLPILLAGSCGGKLVTDTHVHSTTQENVSKVSLSLVRAMDVVAGEWGVDEGHVTDGLSAIEV